MSIASVVAELVVELGGQARDRVVAVWVGGRVFQARRVGVAGGVEAVGVASAAEGGVAELAVQSRAGEHEGVIDGQALGDVDGHGVAVLQGRVAADGAVVEVAGVERHALAVAVEREPPRVRVDGDDAAALAVDDPASEVVAFGDDVVADREAAARQSQLPLAEAAGGAHVLAGARVEV